MDYIKRETILNALSELKNSMPFMTDKELLETVKKKVEKIPAEDVQEVKHGKWVLKAEYKSCAYHATASCSECGWEWIGKDGECVGNNKYVFGAFVVGGSKEEAEQFVIDNARKRKLYNYCPDCGAKMDKE